MAALRRTEKKTALTLPPPRRVTGGAAAAMTFHHRPANFLPFRHLPINGRKGFYSQWGLLHRPLGRFELATPNKKW
jgi:hypothetical protein